MKSRIHRQISKWPNAEDVRDTLGLDSVELVNPDGARYYVFPNTFECADCKSITTFDRDAVEEMSKSGVNARSRTICNHCDAPLSDRDQLPFVAVCECGALDELWVPQCCGSGMRFRRPTTEMGNWFWECVNPNCTNGESGGRNTRSFFSTPVYCPNTNCDNKNMEVMNHTSSSAFHAQTASLINVKPALDNLYSSDMYQARIISDYLLHGDEAAQPSQGEIRKAAAELLGGRDAFFEEDDDTIEDAKERARRTLMTDVVSHREEQGTWLDTEYQGDSGQLAEEVYEQLSVIGEKNEYSPKDEDELSSVSYQELESGEKKSHLSRSKIRKYNQQREELNFDEIRLIKNFPITTVTYGYTRMAAQPQGEERLPAGTSTEEEGRHGEESDDQSDGSPTAGDEEDESEESEGSTGSNGTASDSERPVELNLFHKRGPNAYSEPQLFCQTNDAEAVFIRLDKRKVIEWLEQNGVITNGPDTDDVEAVRKWFLANVITPDRYESLPNDAPPNSRECIARHCYALLNTTAHLFINAMGALAGHQRESLVEHLMPHTMSFVIYKRPDTDFVLGSIWTLFEEQFSQFVEHLRELDHCSYDPVCSHDENGACDDCLYLAAISTENANHNLSRATLFGGPFDTRELIGYKDI